MFKRVYQLFKIARKLGSSGALDTVGELYKVPFTIKLFFDAVSFGCEKK